MVRIWVCALLLLIGISSLHAQESEGSEVVSPHADDLLRGVISDQTLTLFGREFAQRFALRWLDFPALGDVNLSLRERPDPRWGSLIWIEYQGRRVFQRWLSPTRSDIPAQVDIAVRQLEERLQMEQLGSQLLLEPDLDGEEF